MEILTVGNFQASSNRGKKRKRLSKSCNNCRLRKIKCDQVKPQCTSCCSQKLNNCAYENSSEFSVERLKKENELLKERLYHLEGTKHSQDRESKRIDNETVTIKPKRVTYYGVSSFRSMIKDVTKLPAFLKLYNQAKDSRRTFKLTYKGKDNFLGLRSKLSIERLTDVLPGYSEFHNEMDSFFNSIWFECFPIINKEMLNEDFLQIAISNEGRLGFRPLSSQDYSKIAVMLITYKFSLLTKGDLDSTSRKLLFLQDVFLNLIDGVQEDYAFLKRASLATLQALLLQRIFKKFNFFDGDGGDGANGSLMFSLSFHMGITLGLHRNIDELYSCKSIEYRSLLKEIWNCLLYLDVHNSIDLGVPLHIGQKANQTLLGFSKNTGIMILLKRSASTLTKDDVFENDILRVIGMIKSFLDNYQIKPIFEYIQKLNHSQSTHTVLEILEIVPVLSLLQHLYYLLSVHYEKLNQKELYVFNRNITLKYSILVLLTVATLINILAEKNVSDKSFTGILVFAVGTSQQYFLKACVSLMMFMLSFFEVEEKRTFGDVVIQIGSLHDFKDDDDDIYKKSDFLFADAEVVNAVIKEGFSKLFPAQNQKLNYFYTLFNIMTLFKVVSSYVFGDIDDTKKKKIKIDYEGYFPRPPNGVDILDEFFALNSYNLNRNPDMNLDNYNSDEFFDKYFEDIEKFNGIFFGFPD